MYVFAASVHSFLSDWKGTPDLIKLFYSNEEIAVEGESNGL
jgi:hypothetical protein